MIKLNVGGTIYLTTRDTLTSRGDCMLSTMVAHPNPARIVDGAYFIDRDPVIFRWLLNYFRGSNVLPPKNSSELEQLREEADFFSVFGLSTRIQHLLCPSFKKEDHITVRGNKFTIVSVQESGYIVTRCGQRYNIPAQENVESTTMEVGDVVMAWPPGDSRRRKGICMRIFKTDCSIQFDGNESCTSCKTSAIRF